ncbi:MAG: hypothetical protein ACKVHE_33170 [Planctomycetales bacterium]|jgi:hypothetical protein
MDTQSPAGILYSLVKSQLPNESVSLSVVETQVRAVATQATIPQAVVDEVLARFQAEIEERKAPVPPRLFVDWGELPRMGHQVRPEFTLVCSGYTTRPTVRINVDKELDHDPNDRLRRPVPDEDGLWSFHVPFRMTSDGMDCLPGQYLIDLQVSFSEAPSGLARFFRSRIRLKVSGMASDSGGVLEIDGDGQSVVNLQGYNLKQFSRVILKGGQDGVINLQNGLETTAQPADDVSTEVQTTFEYELKVNSDIQSRLPTVRHSGDRRSRVESGVLHFEDGRQIVILARRRVSFGRSRDNDVILRFLPSSEENDQLSRNISRTHMIAELVSEGVEIRDEKSAKGIEVNYSVVDENVSLSPHYVGDPVQVDLGVTGAVSDPFRLEMMILSSQREQDREDVRFWDNLYCEAVGARMSRLQNDALETQIDALRFDRVDNLAGQEAYVMLFREALVGGSDSRSAILLKYEASHSVARIIHLDRTFWLERLPGKATVSVDGKELPPYQLTALNPGMSISFGVETATFESVSQVEL